MKTYSLIAIKVINGEPDPTKGAQLSYSTRESAEEKAIHLKANAAKNGLETYTEVTEETLY